MLSKPQACPPNMSAKAARKALKRARKEQEEDLDAPVRRGPPVAPTSGLLCGTVVNDEWQTVRRSWCRRFSNVSDLRRVLTRECASSLW